MPTPATPERAVVIGVSNLDIQVTMPSLPTDATTLYVEARFKKTPPDSWAGTIYPPGSTLPYPIPQPNQTWQFRVRAVNGPDSSYSDISEATSLPSPIAPLLVDANADGTTITVRVAKPTFQLANDNYNVWWSGGGLASGTWSGRTSFNLQIVGLTAGTTCDIVLIVKDKWFFDCPSLHLLYLVEPPIGDPGIGEGSCLR